MPDSIRLGAALLAGGLLAAMTAPGDALPRGAATAAAGPMPGPEIAAQLQDIWGRHRVLLVGETHGTMEVPAIVSGLVADAAKSAPVVVGLEIPLEECDALQAYLRSPGAGGDAEAAVSGKFWHRVNQDGRSSAALFGLVDDIRSFRKRGLPVTLECFDAYAQPQGMTNDAAMAMSVERIVARPGSAGASFVFLTGNYHAMLLDAPDGPTMGFLLRNIAFSVLVASRSPGSSWNCVDSVCASHDFTPHAYASLDSASLVLYDDREASGYDAALVVERFTASPPMAGPKRGG